MPFAYRHLCSQEGRRLTIFYFALFSFGEMYIHSSIANKYIKGLGEMESSVCNCGADQS